MYDEMFQADGRVRPPYAQLNAHIAKLSPAVGLEHLVVHRGFPVYGGGIEAWSGGSQNIYRHRGHPRAFGLLAVLQTMRQRPIPQSFRTLGALRRCVAQNLGDCIKTRRFGLAAGGNAKTGQTVARVVTPTCNQSTSGLEHDGVGWTHPTAESCSGILRLERVLRRNRLYFRPTRCADPGEDRGPTVLRLALAAGAAAGLMMGAGAALSDVPKARIQGVTDNKLRQEIERGVGTAKNPPQSRFEARRRAEAAAADVATVLRSEGYYEATVEPDVGEGDQPASVVKVTPGPRFTIADPQVAWVGAAPKPPVQIAGKAAIGLTLGGPGRAADVIGAEGRVVAAVRKRGYADAKADPRQVTVDHAPRTVQPTFNIAAGDQVLMDGVHVLTPGRTNPHWVSTLAPWKAGDVYDPDSVAELEKRLRDTGVFDSVNVSLAAQTNDAGERPVDVSLVERPKSTLELGATYSTADNSGVDSKWTRYDRLGLGDTLTFSLQAANILSQAGIELDLPNWWLSRQTLKLSTALYRDDTNAYLETGYRIGGQAEQKFGTNDYRTFGLTLDLSRDQEPDVVNGVLIQRARPLATIITSGEFSIDRSDNILNPTQGWRFQAQAEPSVSFGDGPIAYARTQASFSAYEPFDTGGWTVLATCTRSASTVQPPVSNGS